MQIEPVTYIDLAAINHLQPEGWSDIGPDLEFYVGSDFCHPIKAIENEKIAGIGASIIFRQSAWLAHIIVDAGFRNRGIGYRIVEALLVQIKQSGINTCLLTATELGQPVYLRAGFRKVSEYIFLNREKPWESIPASPYVVNFSEEFREKVYEMDSQVTGEGRDRLLSPSLYNASLYVKNRQLLGYYIPGLKEGLIIAKNADAGIALMNLKYATADKAALPADNKTGVDFLLERGFADTGKKGTRMILGKDIPWQPGMIYSRIGGNVG
jgi:GNAT superfamily N-acetyltransferase